MIEKQAKEIEMKQLSEQKSKGVTPPKISQAALALNAAESGKKEESNDSQTVLGISNDQLYANFVKNDKKTIQDLSQQHESAAITEAKKAANNFAQAHP